MNKLPELPDVTVCAIDTVNPMLAARALDISTSHCRFGDVLLLTHEAIPTSARLVQIERIRSLETYSAFVIKQLAQYVSTPWVLVVQWDGYVVDATQWTDTFFQYDYIGARWPDANDGVNVGNGGFSLRSAKLLRALADERFQVTADTTEDIAISSTWRPVLEASYGIRFAPADIADRFSYEYGTPRYPTFGFHGLPNMWRHVEDAAMIEIIQGLDIRTLGSPRGVALLRIYCNLRKFACVRAIYRRYREHASAQSVVDAFVRNGESDAAARQYVDICESA